MRNYDQNNIFNKEKNRFPYLPNLSIQLLSCPYSERVGCACLYPDVSCRRKPGWGPRRAAPTADSLIPAAAPTHPLRDTHSLTERHFCEIRANVRAGRLGSTARGLVPQMARCRRHQKTVSDEIFGSVKMLTLLRYFVNHHTRQTTWDDPRKQR